RPLPPLESDGIRSALSYRLSFGGGIFAHEFPAEEGQDAEQRGRQKPEHSKTDLPRGTGQIPSPGQPGGGLPHRDGTGNRQKCSDRRADKKASAMKPVRCQKIRMAADGVFHAKRGYRIQIEREGIQCPDSTAGEFAIPPAFRTLLRVTVEPALLIPRYRFQHGLV